MSDKSYLVQQASNNVLDLIKDLKEDGQANLPNDLALSRTLEVSRTTVRTVINHLEEAGIISKTGSQKTIKRKPKPADYFDISDQVASKEVLIENYFLSLISNGHLHPGDRFSELELAKQSHCNTITVREFLIRFSHTGLIQKRPRAQWQMVEFDEDFANELIDFRRILEMNSITNLLEQPMERPVWAELQQLLVDHKELEPHMAERFHEFPKLDERLHLAIQSCSENRFIKQFFQVVSFVCHYHYQWAQHDERERNTVALHEHIDLLNKLLARDIHGAIMSLETHLNTARATLLRSSQNLN